ncbi:MAG: methyltransferase domain-containing protein [Planctomycetia bacterium]|nr:methyltransferase domain-containing protein [Planctomycetia bacterium]
MPEATRIPEGPRDWNERYATGHTPWDSGTPSVQMQQVIAEQQIAPQKTLEIGCGTGTNAVWLVQQGFDVTAVDLVPLAIERAKAKAAAAGVRVDFSAANLLDSAQVAALAGHGPYPFVFDRGVYHCLRQENGPAVLNALSQFTAPGSLYLQLAGNANDKSKAEQGPPRVAAEELLAELGPLFELVQMREFRFDGVHINGETFSPLAWSALLRRK